MSKGKTNQSEALLGWEVYKEDWWENLSEKKLTRKSHERSVTL